MKTRKVSEYEECKAYFTWAQYNPILKEYLIKIVNEGKRTPQNGHRLKLIGLRAGLPDYYLPVPNNNFLGLWVEMKTKSGSLSQYQKEWLFKLNKLGHCAKSCRGWQEAAQLTMDYLANKL